MIKVDLTGAAPFFDAAGPDYASAASAHRMLEEKSGPGAEFTGWIELPMRMKKGELKPILTAGGQDPLPLQGPGSRRHRRLLPRRARRH